MNDIAANLRRTRADMLGTPDEEHYWHCQEAADEIESLRERDTEFQRRLKGQEREIDRLQKRNALLEDVAAAAEEVERQWCPVSCDTIVSAALDKLREVSDG